MSKVDMETAGYKSAGDDGKSCASCESFQPPDQCALVDGTISAGGVSQLYSKKRDEQSVMDQLFGAGGPPVVE